MPAGDVEELTLNTLSFKEFLDAAGERKRYEDLDLFGKSDPYDYEEIKKWYKLYCEIGGYPAAVVRYFETGKVEEAKKEMEAIIQIFIRESERYFDDILEMNLLEQLLPAIA